MRRRRFHRVFVSSDAGLFLIVGLLPELGERLRPLSFFGVLVLRQSDVTSKNLLLHIWDLYDTALCLRVLWIFHDSHVQFFLAFAECDVCCAIARGDLKYV